MWEERFERSCGFWRGFLDGVVARYLDCGLLECGFARVFCRHCQDEFLLPFSCKCRGICSSCRAKRAAAFVAFLKDELLQNVCHAQWVFTIPKMLRLYFLYHRELLGQLCQAAYETVKELMAAAVQDKDIRPGMVAVIQTFAQTLRWNPHVHALATRGDERIELLLSWRHTGFSVDNSVTVYPSDEQGLERLARYMIRSPVNLQRLNYLPQTQQVLYQTNNGHDQQNSEIL
jgi:hypothetical protein